MTLTSSWNAHENVQKHYKRRVKIARSHSVQHCFTGQDLFEKPSAPDPARQIMRRTWALIWMEGTTITHIDQTWQTLLLQFGKYGTGSPTSSYCRRKFPKRCRCSIGRPSAESLGNREQDLPDWLLPCTEGVEELVRGVHTLVWRSVQVYHELQELEEEDKGREEVQGGERESQVEEKRSHEDDHVDGVKDSNILSHGVCARDDVKLKTKEMRLCAQTMRAHVGVSGSGQWCTHRAVPRNHWCCHWRPRHALSPSHRQFWIVHFSEFSTSCPNSHLVIKLYQFIITSPCIHFVHTFASRKHVIRGVVFTEGLVEGESGSSGSAGETISETPLPHFPARLSNKSGGKHNSFIHFPEDSNCDMCKLTQITSLHAEGILKVEQTGYRKLPNCGRKYSYSGAPSSQWRERIAMASSICGSGTRLGYPMEDTTLHFVVQQHHSNQRYFVIQFPQKTKQPLSI